MDDGCSRHACERATKAGTAWRLLDGKDKECLLVSPLLDLDLFVQASS
jgi:hypothetical protein